MKLSRPKFVIDFDSTFVKFEALDELCKIRFKDANEQVAILEQVSQITNQGMNGEISITESLERRITLLNANRLHLEELIVRLKKNVTTSFQRNRKFIESQSEHIYIVSNGFKDFILPVVQEYGIKGTHVYANTFEYDAQGNITGFDKENVLSGDKGKVKLVSSLELNRDCIVIGDGYTDYEIKEAGLARIFYAFIENVRREAVVSKTDCVVKSLDHIIADLTEAAIEESIILTL